VEKGQSIVLTRHGRPVARIVPFDEPGGDAERLPGAGQRLEAGEVREPLAKYEGQSTPTLSNAEAREAALERMLETEIWPQIPPELIGKGPTKKEREEILGTGEEGT